MESARPPSGGRRPGTKKPPYNAAVTSYDPLWFGISLASVIASAVALVFSMRGQTIAGITLAITGLVGGSMGLAYGLAALFD